MDGPSGGSEHKRGRDAAMARKMAPGTWRPRSAAPRKWTVGRREPCSEPPHSRATGSVAPRSGETGKTGIRSEAPCNAAARSRAPGSGAPRPWTARRAGPHGPWAPGAPPP